MKIRRSGNPNPGGDIMNTNSDSYTNCHRTKSNGNKKGRAAFDSHGTGDVPETTANSYYKDAEPLPESSRPRRDGPGGE